jgi:hypothetical protein
MFGEKRAFLTRREIIRVKTKALRRGIWFRALTRVDRACVDLAIIVVERVRSGLLQKVLCSLIRKLEEVMESQVYRLMREVGGSMAKDLSEVAQRWGNKSAHNWVGDSAFIRYLAITYLNMSSLSGRG